MSRLNNLLEELSGDNKVINKGDYQALLGKGISADKIKARMDKKGYTFKGNFNPSKQLAIHNATQAYPNASSVSNELLMMSNDPIQVKPGRAPNPSYISEERSPLEDRYQQISVPNYDYYTSNPEYMQYFDGNSFDKIHL